MFDDDPELTMTVEPELDGLGRAEKSSPDPALEADEVSADDDEEDDNDDDDDANEVGFGEAVLVPDVCA